MNLYLDLENIQEKDYKPFANYIIKNIQKYVIDNYNSARASKLEKFINDNNVIKYKYIKKYTTVNELYRLAVSNLLIKNETDSVLKIYVNNNILIPDTYTKLINIINFLEYGNLSVSKYALLTTAIDNIADNIDGLYKQFEIEES